MKKTNKLKDQRQKKICHADTSQKKLGGCINSKVDFSVMIVIKESINQEAIMILNVY